MSKYFIDKFLYQVDRDPELLALYKSDAARAVAEWEAGLGAQLGNGSSVERTTWLELTDEERTALVEHDYVALFGMGAHFFLSLTIFIGIYDEDYAKRSGPLSFQREMAVRLTERFGGRPYPSVEV